MLDLHYYYLFKKDIYKQQNQIINKHFGNRPFRSEEITASAHADARFSTSQLVALQQKLATLKDALAAAQRVAAARESAAAAAIQRNAADTAAELKKQDVDKQISQSEQEAKVKN